MTLVRSIVLCEGYDDRAFIGGWLTALRCIDPGAGNPRKPVTDPERGTKIAGGTYAWNSRSGGGFILVIPCHSDISALRELKLLSEFPDVVDGLERSGMVHAKLGQHALAADFYRRAFDFVNDPNRRDDYEDRDYYRDQAERQQRLAESG